jgi:glycosyltransferase involved in cell wall biosynthesis
MVDLSRFASCREDIRRSIGAPGYAPLIGSVGRLDRRKHVDDFIRAASIVKRRSAEARFLIVGGPNALDAPHLDELESLADSCDLGDRLSFLGDRDDVPDLLSAMDVLVLLAEGEGMPHIISEAGAACVTVISTRDNGTTEQIINGHSGIFVPVGRPDVAADAIMELINDPALRERLSANLRRKVEAEYSVDLVIPQWELVFDEVLEEGTRGVAA